MKLNFSRLSAPYKEILEILIEINYLAIIFLVPLFFAYLFPTHNIFELNKLALFKGLVWLLILFSGFKFIFFPRSYILSNLSRKEIFSYFNKYLLLPLIFIVGLAMLLIFSINPAQSFFGSYDRQEGFISYLFYFVWFLLVFFNISSSKSEIIKKKIERIIITAVFSGFLISLYGVLQALNIDFLTWAESSPLSFRISSTLGQPNFLASFLLLLIPLTAYLFLKTKNFLVKFFYSFVIILQILSLFFTASRGALFAFALIIFVVFIFIGTKIKISILKKTLIIFSFLAVLIFGVFEIEHFLPGRITSLTDFNYGSLAVRKTFYKVSVKVILEKPFFGYGLENSSEMFIKYYEPDWGVYGDIGATTDRAHNLILDILLNGGIFALLFFSLLYYQFVYLIKRNIKTDSLNSVSLFLGLGLAAYLISLMFSFTIVSGEIFFWLFLAILSSLSFSNELSKNTILFGAINKEYPINKIINKKRRLLYYFFFTLLLIVVAGGGINIEKRNIMADYYFGKLYSTLAENKYFETLILNDYLLAEKTNVVNQTFYNQFLAEKLSEFYPNIKDVTSRYVVKRELLKIETVLKPVGYKNILALAQISGALGKINESENYFSTLREISPFWSFACSAQGQMYYINGKYQKAIDSYNYCLSTIPSVNDPRLNNNNDNHRDNVKTYYYIYNRELANSFFSLHNYDYAEIYYQRAYKNNPSEFTLLKKIADTLYLRGDLRGAIKYNERGLSRNPKDYNWSLALASLYHELGDKSKALDYLKQGIILAPDNNLLKSLQIEYSR